MQETVLPIFPDKEIEDLRGESDFINPSHMFRVL